MIPGLYHRGSRLGVGGRNDLDDLGLCDIVDGGRLWRRGKGQSVFGSGLEDADWVLQEDCRASWEPDVSIFAHRIFRPVS